MKLFLLFLLFVCLSCKGQNTLSFQEGDSSPNATLNEVSWMQGHWKGEAFGGITEEIWSPPFGGSMMFSFKHVADGKINFYEFGHIRQLEKTLVFELKHFEGDLKGWEEKDGKVSSRLIKVEDNRLYFDGFTFEKIDENEINIYVVIEDKENSKEVKFNYKKVKS